MSKGWVIMVNSDGLGRGDQRLGGTLMTQFFRALARSSEDGPEAIIFVNAGVRLLVDGSAVLSHLQELEARGITVIACRTSVEHFDLEDKLEVGDTEPMSDLADRLMGASSVLSL